MSDSADLRKTMLDAAEEWARQVGDHLLAEGVRLAPIGPPLGEDKRPVLKSGKRKGERKGRDRRRAPGRLRASGHVEVSRTTGIGAGVEVIVSFNTPYAAVQHERLDYNHPQGGQAKYLEQPFKDNLPRYEATYAAVMARHQR